jgi:choline dehydrogenase-like flavoprotein
MNPTPTPTPTDEYDVIIIGSGAGGGVTAGVLCEAGKRVLLLERGRQLRYADVSLDHLRNHRLSLYGHNTGPDLAGNPRVFINRNHQRRTVLPHENTYHNNASCVGGGTLVYGAQAWRFMPQDFQMAQIYGVPDGSSLADWPITYNDLEPYYDRAEWEIGVCGQPTNPAAGPRRRGYPMPPIPDNPQRQILSPAAQKLGWPSFPVPMLINTTNYNNRPACIQCGNCIGHACPSDSKNGTQNTMIARALATGNCTLLTSAMAQRIETDHLGKVTGVAFLSDSDDIPRPCTARAKTVVVSAGAIETARLLLNSTSSHHPQGLGNHSDQVGRHLQGHYYPAAFARFSENTYDPKGPGVSIATCQFNHANPKIIGGAMLANDFIKTPIQFWRLSLPPDLPRWGLANKQYVRDNYRRSIHVTGPVQEIPAPDARITIDTSVRDKWNIPVAALSGTQHPETVRTAEFIRARAQEWLTAAGATQIWSHPTSLYLSAGQHQAGTCRMGHDPQTSVTDPFGRVHGHDNLFIADASLHVTNGGFNPVLTIMALSFRIAEHIAAM